MRDASDPVFRWAAAVAVASVVVLCAILRYRFLASSEFAFGVDGYFYAEQLRSIVETGGLRFPAPPLTLYAMAPLAAFAGPIAGVKIGAAIGGALACVPAFAIGRRISGSLGAGLLAAVLVATSPGSFYLTCEFVKNGIAIAIAGAAVVAVLRACDQPTRRRIAVAILALVAAWLSHKLAFAMAAILSAPPALLAVRSRAPGSIRRWLAVAGAVAAALAIAGLLFPDQLIGPGDAELVGSLFTSHARWSLPVLDMPGRTLGFRGEIAIAAAVGLGALAIAVRFPGQMSAQDRAVAIAASALCLFFALPILDVGDPGGLAFRLRLSAFFPLAVCAAVVAGRIASLAGPGHALVAGFALGLAVYRPAVYTEPVVPAHPALVSAVEAAANRVPPGDTIVVPDRQVMYMTAYYTRSRVALRPESVPEARRWRMIPLNLMDPILRRGLDTARTDAPETLPRPQSLHAYDPDGLVLMPEVTWQWILKQLPDPVRDHYRRWPTT